MKIGNLHINGNIFLAPMAGVTDVSFRTLCYLQGCSFAYTEMISAKGLYYNDKKTKELLIRGEQEPYLGVQIFGSDPDIMAHAVTYLNTLNIDLIDINMGCPVPKVVKNSEGSALMKTPELAGEIIKACVNASTIPVTAKIRLGFDKQSVNVLEFSKLLESNGVNAIAIHGRTRSEFYTGQADWSYISEVKKQLSIPVIGNGDITSKEDMDKRLDESKCDGVMIGRACQGNPWIFSQLLGNSEKPTIEEKIPMILDHYKLMVEHKGEIRATLEMRKHASWYIKGERNATKAKNEIFKARTIIEMTKAILLLK